VLHCRRVAVPTADSVVLSLLTPWFLLGPAHTLGDADLEGGEADSSVFGAHFLFTSRSPRFLDARFCAALSPTSAHKKAPSSLTEVVLVRNRPGGLRLRQRATVIATQTKVSDSSLRHFDIGIGRYIPSSLAILGLSALEASL
jgi:hypothetical protein